MTTEKVFGMIDEVFEAGANSSTKVFKEVTEEQVRASLYRPDDGIMDFLDNAKPGEFINWRWPIFRVR